MQDHLQHRPPENHRDLYAAFRFASDIQPQPLAWLWPQRIPLGKLTLLLGDPGVGKSLLAADLAARVSTGRPCPDSLNPSIPGSLNPSTSASSVPSVAPLHPAAVVIAPTDDGPADTLNPRLRAAGADLASICILEGVSPTRTTYRETAPLSQRDIVASLLDAAGPPSLGGSLASSLPSPFTLPDHVSALEETLRAVTRPRLLILDHIHALASRGAQHSPDRHADLLATLADVARHFEVAVLAVAHLTKTPSRRMLYRARGSLAFVAAARSVLLLAQDPAHPDLRILTPLKTIHGPPPPPLTFRIVATQPSSPSDTHAAAPRIEWLPASPSPPPDLLDLPLGAQSALAEACTWLLDTLSAAPRPALDLLKDARRLGLSPRTLYRAKRVLAVHSKKKSNAWFWTLSDQEIPQDCQLEVARK